MLPVWHSPACHLMKTGCSGAPYIRACWAAFALRATTGPSLPCLRASCARRLTAIIS